MTETEVTALDNKCETSKIFVCKYNAQPDINVISTVKWIFSVYYLEFSSQEY